MKPRDRRWLDACIAALRGQAVPGIDAEAVKTRLLAELRRRWPVASPATGARGPAWRLPASWALAAAALCLAWPLSRLWPSNGGGTGPGTVPVAVAPAPDVSAEARLVERPAAGSRLSAEDGELRVDQGGARWTLSLGSSARIVSAEPGRLRVELARGRLAAEVTSSPGVESFIVLAGDTEVAVRGTRFSVERAVDHVAVAVSEGEVAVRGPGSPDATVLAAGGSGRFVAGRRLSAEPPRADERAESSADRSASAAATLPRAARSPSGAARAGGDPASRSARGLAPRSASGPPPSPRAVESGPDGALAASEPAADARVVDAAYQSVQAGLQSCFERHTSGRGAVHVAVDARLSLEVRHDGRILGLRVEPPLAPAVEACAAAALDRLRLGTSPAVFRLDRAIHLSR
jgi:ferric-dicitrate binding protein FerR (iron transport regulator)